MQRKGVSNALAGLLFLAMIGSNPAHAFDFGFKQGSDDASGAVTGAAGVDGASKAAPSLEKCGKPLGKIAIYEPQDAVQKALLSYKLPSPTGLIRLMVQQSNCFIVVERGLAMNNIMQERQLADSGQARKGSNMGKGQLAAADFVMTPEVVFSENNAGGAGGALGAVGSLFGPIGYAVGAVAGSVKFKQAQTTLLLSDTRSGVQLAAAQGSSEKADWGVGGLLGGGGVGVALGAYENTAEGKVVAAAFLDSYNNIVRSVRGTNEVVRSDKTLKQEAASVNNKTGNEASFREGDVLTPKLAKIRVLASPSKTAKVTNQFTKGSEAVADGVESDGFVRITGDGFQGWVEKALVKASN